MNPPTVRLKDLCSAITKGTTPTSIGFDFSDSGVSFLRVQNIFGGSVNYRNGALFIGEDVHHELRRSQIFPGDVLLSIAGTIGRTGVVPANAPPLNCNQALAIIRPTEKVSRTFLRHWLESADAQSQMRGATVTGTIQNLSLSQVGGLQVPLPPLPEQRRIAAILDKADALKVKRLEAMAQLERLTQSIFIEMFGDPIANPKGWPLSDVGTLSELQGGLQVTTARKDLPLEMPYLRVANVYRGRLSLTDIKTIRVTAAEISRTTLAKGDLLIVEGHGNPNEVGRSALWTGEIAPCTHQNHIIRVRFDASKILPIYACAYLNSPTGRRHLTREGKTTSGLNTINASNVRGTPISIPPLELQHAFVKQYEAANILAKAHLAAMNVIDALFASLQHRAFRGEL